MRTETQGKAEAPQNVAEETLTPPTQRRDMGSTNALSGILIVTFLLGSANGVALGSHCVSFTCGNFSEQALVIRSDVMGPPICIINEIQNLGEEARCPRGLTAILLSRSHLLLRSPERFRSTLWLEYGRDNERDKQCTSEDRGCPTPPPSMPATGESTTWSIDATIAGSVTGVSALGLLVLAAVWFAIRKAKYNPVAKQAPQMSPLMAATSRV